MNTNPDAFENDLRALQRRSLPEDWRNEMLQAVAEAQHASRAIPAARTPRWLVAGWSVAWAATVVLYLTTPAEPAAAQAPHSAEVPGSTAAPVLLWDQREAAIAALLASN